MGSKKPFNALVLLGKLAGREFLSGMVDDHQSFEAILNTPLKP
jgi:hypothetical protein